MNVSLLFLGLLTAIVGIGYFSYHRWFATDDATANDLTKSDWDLAWGQGPWIDYGVVMVALFMITIVLFVMGFFLPDKFVYTGS